MKRLLRALISILLAGVHVAFPVTPLDVTVSIFYDSAWNDITGYVMHRDNAPIRLARGRGDNSGKCSPGRMSLQLNNVDGRFTPRNAASPLYGKIGRNTPIRVQVTHNAIVYTRFVGEVTSWPSRWDPTGADVWVQLEASGPLRRIGQSSRPQQSALYRAMIGVASGDIVPAEYWALEDGPDADRFASAVGGLPGGARTDFLTDDPPVPAGYDGIPGSATSVLMQASAIELPVRPYTDTGQWVMQAAVAVGELDDGIALVADLNNGIRITADLNDDGGDGQSLIVVIEDTQDHTVVHFDEVNLDQLVIGVPASLMVAVTDTGGGTDDFVARVLDGAGTTLAEATTTDIGYSTVRQLEVNSAAAEAGVSHVALYTDPAFDPDVDIVEGARAASGWLAESVQDRFTHLCAQARITSEVVGSAAALMGAERQVSRIQALTDAADVDQGLLCEIRDELGLQLRTVASKYNQTPVPLDYALGHIYEPFEPEPDDFGLFNDREVRRHNGSSARAVLREGPLSVADPPDGAGEGYADSISVNSYTDAQLDHIAQWRLHVGTWDEERFPRVRVNFRGSPELIASVAPLDSGDQFSISNLPSWLPSSQADLMVEGYAEGIGEFTWDLIFNCSPAGPYNVVGRWALLSKELRANINNSTTSVDIATTDPTTPMLATAAADIGSGYSVTIGTEELLVTATTASTITAFTGSTSAHADNASVTPALSGSLAQGNLILVLAAIRNSGTGVPDTPSGYTRLAVFPAGSNVQVFAKVAGASETDPTITFTGGVAGASCSAQTVRLAGKWHSTANILIGAASCLNTSAQNINVPHLPMPHSDNCIVIGVAWKQDDWTSVATRSGFTEIGEPDTTLGDDQGIVWDQVVQTTAAHVAGTPFVVTGGAAAISRAGIFALRCDYQTATATRGVNGTTAASHTAADAVTLTRPARWALL